MKVIEIGPDIYVRDGKFTLRAPSYQAAVDVVNSGESIEKVAANPEFSSFRVNDWVVISETHDIDKIAHVFLSPMGNAYELRYKSGVYYDHELYRVPFNLDGLTYGDDLISVFSFVYDETNTYEHVLECDSIPWAVMELLQEAGLSVDMIASFEAYAKSRAKDTYVRRLLEEKVYVYAEDVFVLPEDRKEFITEYLQMRVPNEIVVKDCTHVSYDEKVYTLMAKKTGSPVFFGKWGECVQFICIVNANDEQRR